MGSDRPNRCWLESDRPARMMKAPDVEKTASGPYNPRNAARRTLPLAVFGISVAKSMIRGYL